MPSPSSSRPRTRPPAWLGTGTAVAVAVALAALGGALAGARPSAVPAADVAWSALLAGGAAWAASVARPWTWPWLAGTAGILTAGARPAFGLAVLALVLALVGARAEVRVPLVGAAVGALAVQALLRAPDVGPTGASAAVAVVALAPVVVSAVRQLPPARRRPVLLAGGLLAGVLVVLAGVALVGVLSVRAEVERAAAAAEDALGEVEDADRQAASEELRAAEADLDAAASRLGAWWMRPAEAVPVVGPNVRATRTLVEGAGGLVGEGRAVVDEVDYERIRYEEGAVDLDELGRAAQALARLDEAVARTRADLADVDGPWLAGPLVDRVDEYGTTLAERGRQARTAALAARVAPELLGGEGERTWLVVFPTPAETRGGGGFVGNTAVLRARDGRVDLVSSERISALIEARPPGTRTIEGLPDYVARYGRHAPQDHPQDLLWSPHFPDDASAFAQVAEQSGLGPIDGVLSLDPTALAVLLRFTGPVPVAGREAPLTEADAEQWLLEDQYLAYGGDDTARADALAGLSRDVFDRLTSGSLPDPRDLADALGPMVRDGHLVLWASRVDEQAVLEELGVDGSLPPAGAHDLLHVSGANDANSKIDVHLRREVDLEVAHDPATGAVRSRVRITLHNDAPSSGLPPYVLGNTQGRPPGTNLMLLSTFTPLGLEEVRVDGVVVPVESEVERGYRVYSRFVEVPPGGSVVVELDLAGVIPGMERYRLEVPAQTMVQPDRLVAHGPALGARREVVLSQDRTLLGPQR